MEPYKMVCKVVEHSTCIMGSQNHILLSNINPDYYERDPSLLSISLITYVKKEEEDEEEITTRLRRKEKKRERIRERR